MVALTIRTVQGTIYKVGTSTNVLYAAAGGSDDWVKGVAGIELAYTIELPGGGSEGFDPPPEQIPSIVTETWAGVKGYHHYIQGKFGRSNLYVLMVHTYGSYTGPEMEIRAFAYLDDIIVLSKTFPEDFDYLRLRAANLHLNSKKYQYLGSGLSDGGIQTDPKKVEASIGFFQDCGSANKTTEEESRLDLDQGTS
ncbi:hypothetical protein ILUMI_14070 [Ignelater luminosus]|uniref:Peptidase M14 domain-containing protein n=1 Tax=Ignelater luminosus TaxID=2038154 RepID=A0A8K0CR45_IGNLU|nr:hypothetical protein ILUMI_14070 [Ignelater luminosus]